jgi:predicted nucleic acid-binding protein
VSFREARGTNFESDLKMRPLTVEVGVWGESAWGARWADKLSSECLKRILNIISNGSFPKDRSGLTENQLHQLRDAMILEAHSAARTDVFVSADMKAFINHGRREKLERLLGTRILTPDEFLAELNASAD